MVMPPDIKSLINEYEVKLDTLQASMLMNDPSTVASMIRNISYTANDGSTVVYNFVVVVRDNPALTKMTDDRLARAMLTSRLFEKASECVYLWTEVAFATWEGWDNTGKPRPTLTPFSIHYPQRVGAANVTIFGNITDRTGHQFSLTVTDQSDPEDLLDFVEGKLDLYEYVTTLNNGDDMNVFGALPYRQTTSLQAAADKKKTARQTSAKKSAAKKKAEKAETKATVNVTSVDSSDVPLSKALPVTRATAPVVIAPKTRKIAVPCDTMADVKKLDGDITFSARLGRVGLSTRKNGEGYISLYSFAEGPDGTPVIETGDSIYLYDSSPSFGRIKSTLMGLGVPDEGGTVDLEWNTDVRATATKRISQNQRAYYENMSLSAT